MQRRFLMNRFFVAKKPTICCRHFSNTMTDFGFKDVPSESKQDMVKEIFSKVAGKYDVMNDFMSFGTHRLWKDDLIKMMRISSMANRASHSIPRHLDVAGGTGDVAFRMMEEINNVYSETITKMIDQDIIDKERPIVVCDINPEMLSVGRSRAPFKLGKKEKLVGFVEGNAEDLPFPDNSFDIYTIAFGLRNVTNKQAALQEAYRVLKPGGRMSILEFSTITNPIMSQVYDKYSFNVIPVIGKVVANDEDSYRYLVESIRRFPTQEELLNMIHQAGFVHCSYQNFTFGVVAVHTGFKF